MKTTHESRSPAFESPEDAYHAQVVEGLAAAGRPRSVPAVHPVRAGSRGAVVAATWEAGDGDRVQAVFLVGRLEGAWRIGGRSIIVP